MDLNRVMLVSPLYWNLNRGDVCTTHTKIPICHLQKLPLQRVQFADFDTSDFSIMTIRAKYITQRLATRCDTGDQETMYRQTAQGKARQCCACEIDVSEEGEQGEFLKIGILDNSTKIIKDGDLRWSTRVESGETIGGKDDLVIVLH